MNRWYGGFTSKMLLESQGLGSLFLSVSFFLTPYFLMLSVLLLSWFFQTNFPQYSRKFSALIGVAGFVVGGFPPSPLFFVKVNLFLKASLVLNSFGVLLVLVLLVLFWVLLVDWWVKIIWTTTPIPSKAGPSDVDLTGYLFVSYVIFFFGVFFFLNGAICLPLGS